MGDENDNEETKAALKYLEEAHKLRDDFVKKTVEGLGDRVTKQELGTRLREAYFKSYVLRLAIQGKKVTKTSTTLAKPEGGPAAP